MRTVRPPPTTARRKDRLIDGFSTAAAGCWPAAVSSRRRGATDVPRRAVRRLSACTDDGASQQRSPPVAQPSRTPPGRRARPSCSFGAVGPKSSERVAALVRCPIGQHHGPGIRPPVYRCLRHRGFAVGEGGTGDRDDGRDVAQDRRVGARPSRRRRRAGLRAATADVGEAQAEHRAAALEWRAGRAGVAPTMPTMAQAPIAAKRATASSVVQTALAVMRKLTRAAR